MQFAAQDVEFILSVLGGKLEGTEGLVKLLADEDSRDLILDDEALFRALLERGVADYVAEVLTEFARADRARCVLPGQTTSLDYFFEMLAALQTADDHTRFQIRAHIGNYSLFLSGVFPDRIRERAERRGFPDLSYYVA
ncbi:MAG TPA: hypothetical protein VL863_00355, partial [bacterium]|nr:hypothetical protein [bacterium]